MAKGVLLFRKATDYHIAGQEGAAKEGAPDRKKRETLRIWPYERSDKWEKRTSVL